MIKLREAGYCNLKLLLSLLVIFGHWLEPGIAGNPMHGVLYRWIYLFHMPVFAFLTGLFVRKPTDCFRQIKRLLPLYLASQGLCVLLLGKQVAPLTPVWHLWFLFSACLWYGLAWVLLHFPGHGKTILLAALAVGCFAGFFPGVGRTLSLSRTLVFFPYFWVGVLCPSHVPWGCFRSWGLLAAAAALSLFALTGEHIPTVFLYQAAPYSHPGQILLRGCCYLMGGMLGFFLLTFTPQRRFPWTKAGCDTLWIFLLHAPLTALLRQSTHPWWLSLLCSLGLLFLLYQVLRWSTPLYGIHPSERRNRLWPHLNPFINSMLSRSTDFSSP